MKPWRLFILLCLLVVASLPVAASPQKSAAEYCRQAENLLAQKDYQQTLEAAQRALQVDPGSAGAENLAGTAEFALGHVESAQKHLLRALELQPGLVAARRTLGAAYLKEGQFRDARKEFNLILVSRPNDFLSLYSVGLTYLLDKQPGEALKAFEKASKLKAGDPALLIGILQAQLRLKQEAQAAGTLAELDRHLDAHDPQRLQLAALLVEEGAYGLAFQEFERLRALQPDSYELNYNLALAYHRAGEEAQASTLLQSLIARNENAELEDLLGEVEESRGNRAAALDAFRRASELEPRNEDYRFDYAHALVRQWALDQALKVFAEATKDLPTSPRMWLGLGATYYLAGRYEESARTLLRAADFGPRTPEVYYLLGRAYDAAGSLQDDIAQRFSNYMKTEPKDAWAEYFYGKILAARSRQSRAGNLPEAQQHLEKAVALDSNLAEAYAELGSVLDMRGQPQAALKQLERAIKLDPKSSAAYYKLAQVYRKLGESDRAQKAVAKFEQLKAQERVDLDREQIQGFLERGKR